jgi:mannose-1-phosphate guanylyltransferase / mannose-6-phosphate isomerase
MPAIYPVILSGGSGTRLWPQSRSMYPKQFIAFGEPAAGSFLRQTAVRLTERAGFKAPILLANSDHRFLIAEDLARAGVKPLAILLEPTARNTAAAIAAAAVHVAALDPDAVIAVMPSDHVIGDDAAFERAVSAAADIAVSGRLVLFGITPTSPHTGYGYIKLGQSLSGAQLVKSKTAAAFAVASFREKPDAETAATYLASGDYLWNSGIFVLSVRTIIAELERLQPAILAAAAKAVESAQSDLDFVRLDAKAFAAAPSLSIDHAVMEHTAAAAVMPLSVGWNDIGSWSSLWDIAERDENDNAVIGDAHLLDTRNCYVRTDGSLVATIGVENLVIVDTPDALLVADRSRAQDVGRLVQTLRLAGRREVEQHVRSARPWGFFEQLAVGPGFQVKKLHVKPGGKLSRQMHMHRSEHWVVVRGTARVSRSPLGGSGEVGQDVDLLVHENKSVYIEASQWHRLENPGRIELEIIEVQLGPYLGEDDIIRSDDIYQRAADETK